MTPSERRLHPLSFLFMLGSHLRNFLLPGLLLLVTARKSEWGGWEFWTMLVLVPAALGSLFQYFFFRYSYADEELVIRSGFIFRNERHIPYARIQNIDAVQSVLHRMLGVADVRIETGGGAAPEATMRVLPLAAFDEMRRRVFETRRAAGGTAELEHAAPGAAPISAEPESRMVLRLPVREVLLCGLIQNRGMIVVGAALGLVWELGLLDSLWQGVFGDVTPGRGFFRDLFAALFGRGSLSVSRIALTLAVAFVVLVVVSRALSMGWAAVRLHGFTLVRVGEDLRSSFGLFTRHAATIPVRRIQTLTVHEGPFHRLFRRASVRADTAGGRAASGEEGKQREWLAPILPLERLPQLLHEIVPDLDLQAAAWRPAHPRAFRREVKGSAFVAALVSLALVALLEWWTLGFLALLLAWAVVHARLTVAHLGHAVTEGAILFRSGWIWRSTTIARFTKVQTVAIHESPFDRRAGMARLHVDTAGAAGASHRIHIPYLDRAAADALQASLSAAAASTAFRW